MARPTLFRHRKFARLSRILGSEALALGHLELLWATAYEAGEELIGDSADVEYAAKWSGESGKLTKAFTYCGFLDSTDKGFVVHDLWDHAPEYVRKRRARELERRTTGAKLREKPNGVSKSHRKKLTHSQLRDQMAAVVAKMPEREAELERKYRAMAETKAEFRDVPVINPSPPRDPRFPDVDSSGQD